MNYDQHINLLLQAFCGNKEALDCALKIGKVFRIWDDVWDGDKKHEKQEFNEVFADLAFDLERNKFFREYSREIRAMIFVAWNAWMDANEWANAENNLKKAVAWVIRDTCNEMIFLFAWLIGGREHVRKISPQIREAYLKELVIGEKDNGNVLINNQAGN